MLPLMAKARWQDDFNKALRAGRDRRYDVAVPLLLSVLSSTDEAPEALLYLGRSYHALGEGAKAVASFRSYLALRPDDHRAAFFLGRSYLSLGLAREAARALSRSLEGSPDHVPSLALSGFALLKLRRLPQALGLLERAVGLAPDNPRIYRGYLNAVALAGIRALARGDPAYALQALRFAVGNGLDFPYVRLYLAKALRESGELEGALAEYEGLMGGNPGAYPSLAWQRAMLLLELGRGEEAGRAFAALRSARPDLPDLPREAPSLRKTFAFLSFNEGRYSDAIAEARSYLKDFGGDPGVHAVMAEVLRLKGHLEPAINHFRRAAEGDKRDPGIRSGLVMALWEAGDIQGMRSELDALKRMLPGDEGAEYYDLLCASLMEHEGGSLLPRTQALLRTHPGDPHLMYTLALEYIGAGLPELAPSWLGRVEALLPGRYGVKPLIVDCLRAAGEWKDLRAAYEDALEDDPGELGIRREYAYDLLRREEFADAIPQLEILLARPGSKEKHKRFLAFALRRTGRYKEAAIIYRDLLKASPSDLEYLKSLLFCLERAKSYAYALALLETAAKRFPGDAELPLMGALLLRRKGDDEKAIASLQRAIDARPDDPRPYRALESIYLSKKIHESAARYARIAEDLEAAQKARKAPARASHPAKSGAKASPAGRKVKAAKGDVPTPKVKPVK